ncbi:MAG: VWA domain-containing protein [Bacteroidetes bacterium]|nr:VWA domain-containing protein [Bacteroidota bacterium]
MPDFELKYPIVLWLYVPLVAFLIWDFYKTSAFNKNAIKLSISKSMGNRMGSTILMNLPKYLRIAAIFLVVFIIARPRIANSKQSVSTNGIDMVLALDVSKSMLATDFNPNRFEAARDLAKQFVSLRENDRMGLVVFAGESFTQCPITTDKQMLQNSIDQLRMGLIYDGTAIGMGLVNAIERLKDSDAKSKVIVLLTDGVNNSGEIEPLKAASAAQKFGIRVYTIGLGSVGTAEIPFEDQLGRVYKRLMEVELDEELLKEIAANTNAEYFRATGNSSLQQVFDEIDALETTRMEVASYKNYKEAFLPFAIIFLMLLGAEMIIKYIVIKQVP